MDEKETTPIVKIDLSDITTIIFILVILTTTFRHVINELLLGQSFGDLLFITIPVSLIGIWYFLDTPSLTIRKNKLVPLSEVNPELNEEILLLANANQIKKDIAVFLWPSTNINAIAFGTWNHQYIAVSEGSIKELQPEELSAVIHHELNHLKSGDWWKFELARVMVIVYLIIMTLNSLAPIPTEIAKYHGSLVLMEIAVVLNYSLYLIALVGVIYLSRIREYNADLSVILQMGKRKPLQNALLEMNRRFKKSDKTINNSMSIFGKPNIFHPSALSRINIIENPDILRQEIYQITVWVGLAFAVFLCGPGSTTVVINYTIPFILIFGFPILYMLNAYRTYSGTSIVQFTSFFNCFKISLIFNSVVAMVTGLVSIPWGMLDPDYGESGIQLINKVFLANQLGMLLDNQFFIMTFGTIAVAFMLYISSKNVSWIRSVDRPDIRRQTFMTWGISLLVSTPISLLWIMALNGSLPSYLWLLVVPGFLFIWLLSLILLSKAKKLNQLEQPSVSDPRN